MSDWIYSVVIITQVEKKGLANRLACALGQDVLPGNTFTVPICLIDSDVTTMLGCRTSANQDFIDLLTSAGSGALPSDIQWSDYGLTVEDVQLVLTNLIVDISSASNDKHFQEVLLTYDLQVNSKGSIRV